MEGIEIKREEGGTRIVIALGEGQSREEFMKKVIEAGLDIGVEFPVSHTSVIDSPEFLERLKELEGQIQTYEPVEVIDHRDELRKFLSKRRKKRR